MMPNKVKMQLVGLDGNAFVLMGAFSLNARTHDVKFIIKKVKIEILVYVGVKNETKIIH